MRLGAPFIVFLATLALAAAAAAEVRRWGSQTRAEGLLQQAAVEAQAYVETFDGQRVEAQLEAYALRRGEIALGHGWWLARNLSLLLAGLLLIAAWVQAFRHQLESLRTDRSPAPAPRTGRRPAAHPSAAGALLR